MFPRVIVTLSTFASLSVNSAKDLAVRFFAESTLSDQPRFFPFAEPALEARSGPKGSRMTGSEGLKNDR